MEVEVVDVEEVVVADVVGVVVFEVVVVGVVVFGVVVVGVVVVGVVVAVVVVVDEKIFGVVEDVAEFVAVANVDVVVVAMRTKRKMEKGKRRGRRKSFCGPVVERDWRREKLCLWNLCWCWSCTCCCWCCFCCC